MLALERYGSRFGVRRLLTRPNLNQLDWKSFQSGGTFFFSQRATE